jgi:hypothetical protein
MSKFKDVTDNQGLGLAKMARAKRLSRQLWADAEEDGTFSRVLDAIRDGEPIITGTRIIPPIDARIHIVKVRKLRLDREWQEALRAAGPNGSDENVRQVGHLYLPTGTGVAEEEEHILLNYPNGGGGRWADALAWAREFKLTPNDPRRVFGMTEQNTNLHRKLHRNLGVKPMFVIAPIECRFDHHRRACCTWWEDAKRTTSLSWTGFFGGATDWFSFRK